MGKAHEPATQKWLMKNRMSLNKACLSPSTLAVMEELLDVTVPESIGSRGGKCFSGVQPDETAKATSDTSCDLVILLTGIYPAGKRLFTTSIT